MYDFCEMGFVLYSRATIRGCLGSYGVGEIAVEAKMETSEDMFMFM